MTVEVTKTPTPAPAPAPKQEAKPAIVSTPIKEYPKSGTFFIKAWDNETKTYTLIDTTSNKEFTLKGADAEGDFKDRYNILPKDLPWLKTKAEPVNEMKSALADYLQMLENKQRGDASQFRKQMGGIKGLEEWAKMSAKEAEAFAWENINK
jgi:hypothetical protein